MSKARLVITAVLVEGRSQSEVARAYGVSQSWISRLVARFHREGEAAFEPRSRRPRRSPSALPQATLDLILQLRQDLAGQGLDAGPDTIAWHLAQHHGISVSRASISRYLTRAGLVTPATLKKGRRYAILGITAVAAVLSPPDPFSMLAMMLPTMLLYEASIWAVERVSRQQAAAQAASTT